MFAIGGCSPSQALDASTLSTVSPTPTADTGEATTTTEWAFRSDPYPTILWCGSEDATRPLDGAWYQSEVIDPEVQVSSVVIELLCDACGVAPERHPTELVGVTDTDRDQYQTATLGDALGAPTEPGVSTNLGCLLLDDNPFEDYAAIVHLAGDFAPRCFVYGDPDGIRFDDTYAAWLQGLEQERGCVDWF